LTFCGGERNGSIQRRRRGGKEPQDEDHLVPGQAEGRKRGDRHGRPLRPHRGKKNSRFLMEKERLQTRPFSILFPEERERKKRKPFPRRSIRKRGKQDPGKETPATLQSMSCMWPEEEGKKKSEDRAGVGPRRFTIADETGKKKGDGVVLRGGEKRTGVFLISNAMRGGGGKEGGDVPGSDAVLAPVGKRKTRPREGKKEEDGNPAAYSFTRRKKKKKRHKNGAAGACS